ncbi:hypothetical protein EMIT036CA2_40313 [Chryseobacterium sp. IT-36CA2]
MYEKNSCKKSKERSHTLESRVTKPNFKILGFIKLQSKVNVRTAHMPTQK